LAEFRELPEHELSALGDDEVIAYMCDAREAGRPEAMKLAVAVLVYGYWDILVGRARLKLNGADAEDVAAEAVSSAIASAFDGKSVGEFRSWMHTILSRRIADYYEARKRQLPTEKLVSEGDEEYSGKDPAVEPEGDAFFARECLRQAYEELEERHREVIDLYVLGPHTASEAAALVDGMTEANVHQIASRFQRRVKELLEGGDTS
jgi:RNA polymerase sigma factor (sigma-70 family)